jgi:hypothetical protein
VILELYETELSATVLAGLSSAVDAPCPGLNAVRAWSARETRSEAAVVASTVVPMALLDGMVQSWVLCGVEIYLDYQTFLT